MRGRVVALLGPTGVGKTAVGVELARRLGVSVISCDSMQVYAGFPVMTNQPAGPEEGAELHELVGVVAPSESISAGEYAAMARPLVERDAEKRGWAVVVGGSGLYMRAALAPLASPGPSDPATRELLETRVREEGVESLFAELAEADPAAAATIDPRNVRRVVRALEGVLAGGTTWSGRRDLWSPEYYRPTLLIGLTLDREVLAARIAERTERMIDRGAVDEVRGFCEKREASGCTPGAAGVRSAIGYGEIWAYLAGKQGREETIEQIAVATRKYARRQATWLRKAKDAVMIDVEGKDARQLAEEILALAHGMASGEESLDQ